MDFPIQLYFGLSIFKFILKIHSLRECNRKMELDTMIHETVNQVQD